MAGSTRAGRARPSGTGDHPRVGGEHVAIDAGAIPAGGSSPRWGGARASPCGRVGRWWIIPALAGSTGVRDRPRRVQRDHPRVGGEHVSFFDSFFVSFGSSPRWRGARGPQPRVGRPDRIIPALAGSTAYRAVPSLRFADHPRVGGEHIFRPSNTRRAMGSSPRWRGAPWRVTPRGRALRIIPALAGSTSLSSTSTRSAWDHPRVGGEHDGIGELSALEKGSSPRWRGAPPDRHAPHRLDRIIPALAGSTFALAPIAALHWGSSPRWRGAQEPCRGHAGRMRIIPALAGSTRPRMASAAGVRDHPRVGGEHDPLEHVSFLSIGSSPRWRGAHDRDPRPQLPRRIIPALAGSTLLRRGMGAISLGSSPRWRGARANASGLSVL